MPGGKIGDVITDGNGCCRGGGRCIQYVDDIAGFVDYKVVRQGSVRCNDLSAHPGSPPSYVSVLQLGNKFPERGKKCAVLFPQKK